MTLDYRLYNILLIIMNTSIYQYVSISMNNIDYEVYYTLSYSYSQLMTTSNDEYDTMSNY